MDKPFSVEYANDMPGSAFSQIVGKKKGRETGGDGINVGDTDWNMRGVSRANGSLLKFMKEEIPGVTSPMVYIAMLFSWFAWHVEDHDLHSLNYMHMGAGKTWYGVPREAAVAFEDVIRVHGYGGEINPIVTFATLGEKTTVMSPEVLLSAGVPCCRLVQHAGEFVVTFPRAYHSGFSHGFNCGEAANIATPGWLRVAKDAAIRRASINCSPMVSHFQLLYDLALSLSTRVPVSIRPEPRSSRLKDKKKGEGETLVKQLFVQDVMLNNDLLQILGKGSPIALLPQSALDKSVSSNLYVGSHYKLKPRPSFGLRTQNDEMKSAEHLTSDHNVLDKKQGIKSTPLTGLYWKRGKFSSSFGGTRPPLLGGDDLSCSLASQTQNMETARERNTQCDRLPDRGLFSCVTCGILCYACVAIIQPSEAAAHYLMSSNCSVINDWVSGSGVITDGFTANGEASAAEVNSSADRGRKARTTTDGLFDVPIKSAEKIQTVDESEGLISPSKAQEDKSSLGLLALTYGDSSDSEDDQVEADVFVNGSSDCSLESKDINYDTGSPSLHHYSGATSSDEEHEHARGDLNDRNDRTFDCSVEFETNNFSMESNCLGGRFKHHRDSHHGDLSRSSVAHEAEAVVRNGIFAPRSDEDSSMKHVFCLQHAVEVEQQLRPIGGVHMLLLCHPDYPNFDAEARLVAEELGTDDLWNDIEFREATEEDEEGIRSTLVSEEATHENGDWAVKLGINLFYSANLSRSPLYSKQMPYNSVIYNAFGRSSPADTPTKPKGSGRQKKIVVAGKWCGKVWMSNQVHPLLAERDPEEEEHDKSFLAFRKHDVKLERQPQSTQTRDAACASTGQGGKKRKNTGEIRPIVKAKFPKAESPVIASDHSPLESFRGQNRRSLRKKQMKKQTTPQARSTREFEMYSDGELEGGPSTRLRKRVAKQPHKEFGTKLEQKSAIKKQTSDKKVKKALGVKAPGMKAPAGHSNIKARDEGEYPCDIEGCTMSFGTKQELAVHKRNICPVKGCGKKFFSHKYLVQHRRVHEDDRPLKCPWKGCKMTFKWAWARTEHIRVHTGARPYICSEDGCGQTFRFVSDFSRHKRRTGHSTKKGGG